MPEVPDEATLEAWLLGDVYRIMTLGCDRRADGPHQVDHTTGLPLSTADLRGRHDGLRGEALALQQLFQPRRWAQIHMGLAAVPDGTWNAVQLGAVVETETKIKRVIRKLAGKGYMDEHPPMGEYGQLGLDRDGYAAAAVFTPEGLKYAAKRTKGTKLAHGPVSILADLPPEQRRKAPDWAQAEYRQEVGE